MYTTQPNLSAANQRGFIEGQTLLNSGKTFPCQKFDTINQNTSTSFKPNEKNQLKKSQSCYQSSVQAKIIDANENFYTAQMCMLDMEIQFAHEQFEWAKLQLSNAAQNRKRNEQYLIHCQIEWKKSITAIPQNQKRKALSTAFFQRIKSGEQMIKDNEKYLKNCLEKVVKAKGQLIAFQQAKTQMMLWK